MSQAFRWVIRFCVILVSIAGAGSVNAGFIPILLDETNFQKAIPNTAVPGEFDLLELSSALSDQVIFNYKTDPPNVGAPTGLAILISDASDNDPVKDPADSPTFFTILVPGWKKLALQESGTGPWTYTPLANDPGYYQDASGNTPQYTISSDPVTSRDIPEPSTLMFFGTGIIALAWSYRRGAAKLRQ
ncbi:MAG TPA: PEP-CTERM sorting domain-containing protein [Candidatus Methylomirabilis sp.]|nr:PEP-CTERM sorting domain-containing protein [Candidatus Methylomirabilis sp.]